MKVSFSQTIDFCTTLQSWKNLEVGLSRCDFWKTVGSETDFQTFGLAQSYSPPMMEVRKTEIPARVEIFLMGSQLDHS